MAPSLLALQNPHSVLAALRERPAAVHEIRLASAAPGGAWEAVVAAARRAAVVVRQADAPPEPSHRRGRLGRSGSVEAVVEERPPVPLTDLFANPGASDRWLALDSIQDPHNVGAIFRTAAFFGVRGILLTRDRAAPLSAVVYDVASGGMERVPFTVETNLARSLDVAREAGLWVLGSAESAETPVQQVPRDRPWLLVLGNEERGLRRLTLDSCDLVCQIHGVGGLRSLNVSVAAGVLLSALTETTG